MTSELKCVLAANCTLAGNPEACHDRCPHFNALHAPAGRHSNAQMPPEYELYTVANNPVRDAQAAVYKLVDQYVKTFGRQVRKRTNQVALSLFRRTRHRKDFDCLRATKRVYHRPLPRQSETRHPAGAATGILCEGQPATADVQQYDAAGRKGCAGVGGQRVSGSSYHGCKKDANRCAR